MLGILAAAIWLLAAAAHGQAEADTADPGEDPSPRIESFHAALLEAMRSNDAYDVRFASLSPVVGEVFDVPTIARISLGRTWKSLDEPARAQFCELLEELITATYTDRFDSYSGQTFHLLSAEPARRGWGGGEDGWERRSRRRSAWRNWSGTPGRSSPPPAATRATCRSSRCC